MSKTVMLVDDEEIIRSGISSMVLWEENGFILKYAASNGLEALEYLQSNQVDIVITDIKMPVMDGIELVRRCTELQIPVQFVMLTGFGEFEYARSTMKFGVQHYLLKPCSESEIIGACQDVAQKIDQLSEIHGSVMENQTDRYQLYQDSCVDRIIRLVEENLSDPDLNLKWIAHNKLFMNENYLSKLFSRITGKKFSQYLAELRIQKAKTLMKRNPDIKMVSLCQELGFANNPTYFSTMFKNQTGMTLTEYRKSLVE